MALRCHRDFPIGRLVDQSSRSLHPDPQGSMRFQAVELSPNSFSGWEGVDDGGMCGMGGKVKQGENMEFSCENLRIEIEKKTGI